MLSYRRTRMDGGTYFFTVNTFRRQPFLTDVDVRAALRAGLAKVRRVPRVTCRLGYRLQAEG
jgi:putative transposase